MNQVITYVIKSASDILGCSRCGKSLTIDQAIVLPDHDDRAFCKSCIDKMEAQIEIRNKEDE